MPIKKIIDKFKKKPNSALSEMDKKIHKEFKAIAKNLDAESLTEYVYYLRSPWRIWWNNFFAGLARGLGFVIGATILVSIFVWIFSIILPRIPWVGDFFTWINEKINISDLEGMVNSIMKIADQLTQQTELLNEIANKLN